MQTLTPDEADHFLAKGYVTIPGCFTRDFAQPLIDHAYERLGYDPDDPVTWIEPIRYLDHAHRFKVKDLCPPSLGRNLRRTRRRGPHRSRHSPTRNQAFLFGRILPLVRRFHHQFPLWQRCSLASPGP